MGARSDLVIEKKPGAIGINVASMIPALGRLPRSGWETRDYKAR